MSKPDSCLRFLVRCFVVFMTVMFVLLGLMLLLQWLGILT
jgi:hypothetical protein